MSDTYASRLEAEIDAYDLVGFDDDPGLNKITAFAAALCDAPISLVTLVEADRQRFLSDHGLGVKETPRAASFCAHAMGGSDIMVVSDAGSDERFRNNLLVVGTPFIKFYAGVPLKSARGFPLGSLCVIDQRPRDGLSPLQEQGLRLLAAQVMVILQLRERAKANRETEAEVKVALNETEQKFRILADTMPQMVWSTLPDGYHDYYNARWYEFTGVPVGSTDGEGWNGMFHADDQEMAWKKWRHSLATGEPYEVEYRLRDASGNYRWTLGRSLPMKNEAGEIVRWFGTCTDIHEQRLLLEQREMVSQELSHRIKNIFSVIGGLVGLSSRAHPEIKDAARDLRARIMALGKAHDFVRPHSAKSRPSAAQSSLHGLLQTLLAPYGKESGRIRISGCDAAIDDRSATPLALVFHELATNAAKYGALAYAQGAVDIGVEEAGDEIKIQWTERDGPSVEGPPETFGFGSRLIELSLSNQLGGTVERSWTSGGLRVLASIPKSSLSRDLIRTT